MATVDVYTADRMKAIEDGTVTTGAVVNDHLILTRHDGTTVDAGNVRGPQGVSNLIDFDTDGVPYLKI